MLEVVDQIGQERHGNPRLYEMLVGAIGTLAAHELAHGGPRVLPEGRSALEGSAPVLEPACRAARRTPSSWWPSTRWRGACCAATCRRGRALSAGGLDAVAADPGRGVGRCARRPRSPVTDEVTALATEAMEAHLDRRLRSVHSGQVT